MAKLKPRNHQIQLLVTEQFINKLKRDCIVKITTSIKSSSNQRSIKMLRLYPICVIINSILYSHFMHMFYNFMLCYGMRF